MTEKEMKKLSRAELLELLLVQTKETERLQKQLEQVQAQLADRQLQMQKVGDLAHAVLEINGVMEAAQAAAQQYLDNIVQMESEAKLKCEKMLADAQEEAAQIRKSTPKISSMENVQIEEVYDIKSAPMIVNSDNVLIEEVYDLLGEEEFSNQVYDYGI